MAVHEPLLNTSFLNWEQKAQPAKLFELENRDAMALCHFPDIRLAKYSLRGDGGHTVEGVIYDPVKHFDQEGVLLQKAREKVIPESSGIWRMNCKTTYPSRFWKGGCHAHVLVLSSAIAQEVKWEEFV